MKILQVHGGDEATLRRFIAAQFSSPFDSSSETTVYISNFPDEPVLTIPEALYSAIIGSIDHEDERSEFLLESDLTPSEAIDQYRDHFLDAGWQIKENVWQRSGFVQEQVEMFNLCNEATGQTMHIRAQAEESGCFIRLSLQTALTPCDDPNASHRRYAGVMPSLPPPPKSRVKQMGGQSGSSQGGEYSQSSSATLYTSLSLDAINDHYRQALQKEGWQQVNTYQSDNLTFANWTFDYRDQSWTGRLFISHIPDRDYDYRLFLQIYNI
jgi:hypothetical protein